MRHVRTESLSGVAAVDTEVRAYKHFHAYALVLSCTGVTLEMHLHTLNPFLPSSPKNISARVSFGSHSPQSLQECQISKNPPPFSAEQPVVRPVI